MALPNNTFARPGVSFYALATESGKLWYTYPSETGEVLLNDASGTQVLQAIGGDLFFNQELLAKASDIQDISEWALYPALDDVNVDGKSLLDISSAVINNSLSAGDTVLQTLDVVGGINNQTNIVTATLQVAGEPVPALGQITAKTIATSGNIQGASLTTTGGLDMSNTAITRASTVNISNSGFAPYGALTSPDGVALTWNGASINTGSSGSAAAWANFPAVTNVNMNSNSLNSAASITASGTIQGGTISTGSITATANTITGGASTLTVAGGTGQGIAINGTSIAETSTSGTISRTSASLINDAGSGYGLTVDRGLNIVAAANVDITAQNGAGGNIALNAQPGYQLGNQQVGFGAIQLNAFGSSNQLLGLGGKIDINAYSGGLGEYGSATSRVAVSGATIALSAGAVPTLPGTAGAMNIFGQDIISIVASLLPPILPQFPQTVYIYGDGISTVAGGVRLSSPNGVQIADNSELYATDIYPYTSNGLNLKGRASFPGPAADVTIEDCASIDMRNAGTVTGVQSITMAGTGVVTGVQSITMTGTAGITGVATINGVVYPPPVGDVADWALFAAKQNVDISGFDLNSVNSISMTGAAGITGVVQINGIAYPPPLPPIGDVADWALFAAKQNVDISGFDVNSVATINTIAGAAIISAGALSVFSDASGDLSLAANGGGNVNIGTGNAGDINIQTVGAGNNLNLAGDTATVTAAVKINLDTPIIDVVGADIQNVSNITNEGANLLTVQSTVNLTVSAETALTLVSDSADVTVQGQTGIAVYAATGNVTLTADSGEVVVQDSVLNMNSHKITNLTNGSAAADAVNYGQLTFRDSTEFYVSNQGSDVSGNGSILAPFLTIQKAITTAELISSAALVCSINVASGHFTENLTFNKGYIVLNGTLQSQTGNEVCEITGSITINCTGANDVFNRQVAFQGFNISCGAGQSITNTSSSSHTVSFQDCKIFVTNVCYISTASCADARTYFTNVEITSTNAANVSPVITTNVGLVELERVDLTVDGNAIGVLIAGTSVLNRCSLSTLDATNTAATLLPLLSITSTTTSTHSLGNMAFAFTSAVAKTATNAVYINSGIATAIIALNCVFTLAGTASSTNNCVGYSGVGSPTIAGVNNTSLNVPLLLPQTVSVQAGITQISYTDINPPVMGAYSKSNDQTIAAVNTPVAIVFNTTQFQQGTALATTRLQVSASGNYQVNYQVQTQASISATVTTYLAKNGTAIINTGSQYTSGTSAQAQTSPQFIITLNAGDYIELFINSNSLGTIVNSTAGAGAVPAIPGAIITVTQIR